jgi:hypothetical protein
MAGIDFFTVEVLTWRGLVTYYILFFIHLESRWVVWRESRGIRTNLGWSRWLEMRQMRVGDI